MSTYTSAASTASSNLLSSAGDSLTSSFNNMFSSPVIESFTDEAEAFANKVFTKHLSKASKPIAYFNGNNASPNESYSFINYKH